MPPKRKSSTSPKPTTTNNSKSSPSLKSSSAPNIAVENKNDSNKSDDNLLPASVAAACSLPSFVVKQSLHQCAESHVYDATFCGAPAIVKVRVKKDYRHQVLDERIRFQRMQREARALARAAKNGVPVPTVYFCDKRDCSITMEKILGCTVREVLEVCCRSVKQHLQTTLPPCSTSDELRGTCSVPSKVLIQDKEVDESFFFPPAPASYKSPAHALSQIICSRILFQMGRIIAKLHSMNAMHGDLTTSNFMVRGMNIKKLENEVLPKILKNNNNNTSSSTIIIDTLEEVISGCEVVIIDFGLVQESSALEERAVDLYVLERAIMSTHPTLSNAGSVVLDGYCAQVKQMEAALEEEQARAKDEKRGFGGKPNKQSANHQSVMDRLETVRARGRKRSMLG